MNKPSTPQAIHIITEDGYALSGHFLRPKTPSKNGLSCCARPPELCSSFISGFVSG